MKDERHEKPHGRTNQSSGEHIREGGRGPLSGSGPRAARFASRSNPGPASSSQNSWTLCILRADARCLESVGALAATLVCVSSPARAADPTAGPPAAPSGVVGPAVAAPPVDNRPFQIDPVSDAALIAAGAGYGGILELILSTGEVRPQRPVDPNALLGIDSVAVTQTFDPSVANRSNFGLYTALAFAVLDPILSGFRDGRSAALVDATLYAESLSLTFALTDLAKIAVRRPRPSAYVAQAQLDRAAAAWHGRRHYSDRRHGARSGPRAPISSIRSYFDRLREGIDAGSTM